MLTCKLGNDKIFAKKGDAVMKVKMLILLCCLLICSFGKQNVFANTDMVSANLFEMTVEELLNLRNEIDVVLEEKGHEVYFDIERGTKGEEVSAIQERLVELGYYTGKITGKYDSETQKAFKIFEKANGLESDSLASRSDQIVLFDEAAIPKDIHVLNTEVVEKVGADVKEDLATVPEFLVETISCWTTNTGINGVTLYVPYLKTKVTNQRGKEAGKITVDVVFYNESTKELWDDETCYLVGSGDVPLKDSYSKTAYIKSVVGYQRRIDEGMLPTLTAEIYVNDILYDEIIIENVYELK